MSASIESALISIVKPRGISSRAAIDVVARAVRPAKAGHAGTLDPLATGVLVVCVGRATRLIEFVQAQTKSYRAGFQLGVTSETDDIEGELVELQAPPVPSRDQIEAAAGNLTGELQQRPPAFSAIKVDGRRSYRLARAGRAVELAPRPIRVDRCEVLKYEYPHLEIDIDCSSGTYVRALGRDLAAGLGTGAVMTALVRTAVGRFTLDQSCSLEAFETDAWRSFLLPALAALGDIPQQRIDPTLRQELAHGRPLQLAHDPAISLLAAIDDNEQLLGVLRRRGDLWFASPNFAAATDG
ncbi:MAG: tRNA pseudouridine(55) synthase TruB [Pirellulales bacterium]|nr:tRNA pseudouridine(55) synthase TruB [Pirellulales bacterium]